MQLKFWICLFRAPVESLTREKIRTLTRGRICTVGAWNLAFSEFYIVFSLGFFYPYEGYDLIRLVFDPYEGYVYTINISLWTFWRWSPSHFYDFHVLHFWIWLFEFLSLLRDGPNWSTVTFWLFEFFIPMQGRTEVVPVMDSFLLFNIFNVIWTKVVPSRQFLWSQSVVHRNFVVPVCVF